MSVGSTRPGTLALRRSALVVVAMVASASLISACSAVATAVSFATQAAARPAQAVRVEVTGGRITNLAVPPPRKVLRRAP